ncbi:hypothetical protein BJF90_10400 [Pseudonocardia sp. CNS-004]|nr:hypothetical protein BJF90_10400 [Pseudonocardia sp. CNS-004]
MSTIRTTAPSRREDDAEPAGVYRELVADGVTVLAVDPLGPAAVATERRGDAGALMATRNVARPRIRPEPDRGEPAGRGC